MSQLAHHREWLLLQQQHEHYEFAALAIKLLAVLMLVAAWGRSAGSLTALLLLVLWAQDAIVKTFQARLGARLLRIEQMLRDGAGEEGEAMQLHSEWLATRPRGLALLGEYGRSACRPTVAFPYPLLLALALLFS